MKKSSSLELNRQILEEASDWFVDFRVGDVDASARAHFDEWLRRSPEHIRAYWEIAKTYVELPALTPPEKLNIAELIAYARSDDNVVPLHASSCPEVPQARRFEASVAESRRIPPQRRRFVAAASIAFAVAIAGGVFWQAHRYPLYATDIGERRSITLADGSTVDLNARSKLRVEFSGAERRVELLDGQALFEVARDQQRPFIVHSGDATVRAVGTQFDVYRKESGTTITVLEGRVAVYSAAYTQNEGGSRGSGSPDIVPHASPASEAHISSNNASAGAMASVPAPLGLTDPSGSGAVLVSAGEQVTVTPDAIVPPHRTDPATATAWMQRKLIFEGTKLSDVVDEFNRYNRTQIVIEDPNLKDFEISGVYASPDPASLLRFLRDQGVEVTESGGSVQLGRTPRTEWGNERSPR